MDINKLEQGSEKLSSETDISKDIAKEIIRGVIDDCGVDTILEDRAKTHGDYADVASASISIQSAFEYFEGYQELDSPKMYALQMIAGKIARILCGDSNHLDHWADISGYAKLAGREIRKENNND